MLLVVPTTPPGWVEGSSRGVAKPRLTFRYFDFADSSGESDTGVVSRILSGCEFVFLTAANLMALSYLSAFTFIHQQGGEPIEN